MRQTDRQDVTTYQGETTNNENIQSGIPPSGRCPGSLEPIGLVQQIGMVALQRCLLTGLHVLLRPWMGAANSCRLHPTSPFRRDSRVTAPIPSDQVLRALQDIVVLLMKPANHSFNDPLHSVHLSSGPWPPSKCVGIRRLPSGSASYDHPP